MPASDAPRRVRRWDPLVRLTHWGIVASVTVNALVTEEGSGPHQWVGYALAALLALRLLWGLVGTPEARFLAFPPSPARALAHIRDMRAGRQVDHASHNPLGALMVYAIWSCLAVIIASGLAMAPPFAAPKGDPASSGTHIESASVAIGGDENGEGGEHEEGVLTEVHEIAVNLLYLLIALHLAGVIFETRRSGPQVVRAMLPWRSPGRE